MCAKRLEKNCDIVVCGGLDTQAVKQPWQRQDLDLRQ